MRAFECKMCGTCCYGEGGIRLDEEDVVRISEFLGTAPKLFIDGYCETRNDRLYIKCGTDGYCIFHDEKKQCLIHTVSPLPCALWPFYPAIVNDRDTWQSAKEACPGINPDCPYEEFVRQAQEKQMVTTQPDRL